MKKSICLYAFGMLLISGAVLTACASDDSVVDNNTSTPIEAGKTYYMRVNAQGNSTRALTADCIAYWKTTENIYVRMENDGDYWFEGALHPESSNLSTPTVPVYMSGSVTIPTGARTPETTTFNCDFRFPQKVINYTGQKGTLEDIEKNYDFATGTVGVYKDAEDQTILHASTTVDFANQQAIVKFTLSTLTDDEPKTQKSLSVSKLRISASNLKQTEFATGDITIEPVSPTNEIYAALSGINDSRVTLTATASDGIYVCSQNGITFANGDFQEIPVQMTKVDYPIALSTVNKTRYVGSVVGEDGYVYHDAAAATAASTTAVAMIAYVGNGRGGKGLAIALADESEESMSISDAQTAINKKAAISGGTWHIPYAIDWKYMFIGCGNGATTSDATVNYTCFNAKIATAGGTSISSGSYYWDHWSGDQEDPSVCAYFGDTEAEPNAGNLSVSCKARAVLAF